MTSKLRKKLTKIFNRLHNNKVYLTYNNNNDNNDSTNNTIQYDPSIALLHTLTFRYVVQIQSIVRMRLARRKYKGIYLSLISLSNIYLISISAISI
jgi:hypothetical protein